MDTGSISSAGTTAAAQDSSSSAADSRVQPDLATPVASCESILDHRLHSTLLRHPSISQDQQVVAALLQTSQQLQAAVAQLLPGQLPVVLHARKLQQATCFAQWLQKHGGLLQELAVHVSGASWHGMVYSHTNKGWSQAAVAALTAATHATAAAGPLPLRSFIITGAVATPDLLQQLPAAHLTQLQVEVALHNSASMNAVRASSTLRSLTLFDHNGGRAAADVLYSLATGLQQLTQLRLGVINPVQLVYMAVKLPPLLQQLHVRVDAFCQARQLMVLAAWLKQHGHIVRTLQIRSTGSSGPDWEAAWNEVGSAFQAVT
jgi:hypothetical protein